MLRLRRLKSLSSWFGREIGWGYRTPAPGKLIVRIWVSVERLLDFLLSLCYFHYIQGSGIDCNLAILIKKQKYLRIYLGMGRL